MGEEWPIGLINREGEKCKHSKWVSRISEGKEYFAIANILNWSKSWTEKQSIPNLLYADPVMQPFLLQ
jgi:hypothetical protein